jgi:hypothetical protein
MITSTNKEFGTTNAARALTRDGGAPKTDGMDPRVTEGSVFALLRTLRSMTTPAPGSSRVSV